MLTLSKKSLSDLRTKHFLFAMNLPRKEIIGLLKKFAPSASSEALNQLIDTGHYTVRGDRETIITPGMATKKLVLIISGSVRGYFYNNKGDEKVIFFRPKGYFAGDIGKIFYNQPGKYTFETIGRTELIAFDFDTFKSACINTKGLTTLLTGIYEEVIYTLNNRVENMITLSNEAYYRELLSKKPELVKTLKSKELAQFMGINPVSLSRIVHRIKNKEVPQEMLPDKTV